MTSLRLMLARRIAGRGYVVRPRGRSQWIDRSVQGTGTRYVGYACEHGLRQGPCERCLPPRVAA